MGMNGPESQNDSNDQSQSSKLGEKPKSPTKQKQAEINERFKGKLHKIGHSAQDITKGNWDPHHAAKAMAEAIMEAIKLLLMLLQLLAQTLKNKHHQGLDKHQRAQNKIDETHPKLKKDNTKLQGQIEDLQEKLHSGKDLDGNPLSNDAKQQLKDSQKQHLKQVHKNEKRMEKDKWALTLAKPKMEKKLHTDRLKEAMALSRSKPCKEHTDLLQEAKKQYKQSKKALQALEKQRDLALEKLGEKHKSEMQLLEKGAYKPFEQLHQAIKDSQTQIQSQQQVCDKAQEKFDGKDKEFKQAEKELRLATKAFEDKRAELDKIDTPSTEQTQALKQLEDTKNQAQKKLDDLKPEHGKLQKALETAKDDLSQAKKGLETAKDNLKAFNDVRYEGLEDKQRQHVEQQDKKLFDLTDKVGDYQAQLKTAKDERDKSLKAHSDNPTDDTERAVRDHDKKIKGLETGLEKAENDLTQFKQSMFEMKSKPAPEDEDLDLGNLFDEPHVDEVNPLTTVRESSPSLSVSESISEQGPSSFQDLVEHVGPLTEQLDVIHLDQQKLTGTPISGQPFQQSGMSSHVTDLNLDGNDDSLPGQQSIPTHLREDSDVHNVSDGLHGSMPNPQISLGPQTDLTLDPMHKSSLDEREQNSLRQESQLGLGVDGPKPEMDKSRDLESGLSQSNRLR